MAVPPRDRSGLRTGFTTGACAAAAARAATRLLLNHEIMTTIETVLPNRSAVTFALQSCEFDGEWAKCSVIKDAGDDPDCTHGAEIIARVKWSNDFDIALRGGLGVATVTKPGLGLELGGPAINPVPRRNITEMVAFELGEESSRGVVVEISVPNGEEMAKKTTNARLGLVGGISILGTTGIVKPYSTAAYKASVVQAIELANELGARVVVLTTGGKSEHYAMAIFPEFIDEAFIQVGDFIGVGVRHAMRKKMAEVRLVAMMGKLSKIGDGVLQTHQAGSKVDIDGLAEVAASAGASAELVAQIRRANTARHVLEMCTENGFLGLSDAMCHRAALVLHAATNGSVALDVTLVDFDGVVLGRDRIAATPALENGELKS